MRFNIALALLLLPPLGLVLLATAPDARAEKEIELQCTCQPPESVITAVQLSNAVFTGKVTDIRPYKSKRPLPKKLKAQEIIFDVYQSWKGVEGTKTKLIRVSAANPECDYPFEKGKEYIVYADKTAFDVFRMRFAPIGEEILDATRCSRTKLLDAAQFDRRLLGPGFIP